MTFAPGTDGAPRVRALAEEMVDGLLARAAELSRRWAIALVLARPADGFGDVPLEEMAHEGPALVAQLVRALCADAELDQLAGSAGTPDAPVRRLGAIAGARTAPEVVAAVEALRGVLWDALSDELRDAPARLVGDSADRLAHVCAGALAGALAGADASPVQPGPPHRPERRSSEVGAGAPASVSKAVIVDERDGAPGAPTDAGRSEVATQAAAAPGEIQIRDERGEEGPAAWIGSIGRELQRFTRDEVPFAVLLVEVLEPERLARLSPGELGSIDAQLETALVGELWEFVPGPGAGVGAARAARGGSAPSLTRERPGRYWLLAPTIGAPAARELADGLAHAVARAGRHGGAPLDVAVGTAVCPEDGRDAPVLAAHADVGLYAARAAQRAAASRR